jgi:hypothetical protein
MMRVFIIQTFTLLPFAPQTSELKALWQLGFTAKTALTALMDKTTPGVESTTPIPDEAITSLILEDATLADQEKNKQVLNNLDLQTQACMQKSIQADLHRGMTESKDLATHAAELCGKPIVAHFASVLKQPFSREEDYLLTMAYEQIKKTTLTIR